jgi:hypothetical protein
MTTFSTINLVRHIDGKTGISIELTQEEFFESEVWEDDNNPANDVLICTYCDDNGLNWVLPRGGPWRKPDEEEEEEVEEEKRDWWGTHGDGIVCLKYATEEYMEDHFEEWGVFEGLIDSRKKEEEEEE